MHLHNWIQPSPTPRPSPKRRQTPAWGFFTLLPTQNPIYSPAAVAYDLPYFSERELMFTFAICRRRSVCLSVVCRLSSVDLWRNLCTSLLYFLVRVRCRPKESSRSLSHLLMSFLYILLWRSPTSFTAKWRITSDGDHCVWIFSKSHIINVYTGSD